MTYKKQLGLFRLMDYREKEEIEDLVDWLFADLYDSAEQVRDNVRSFEQEINALLYGDSDREAPRCRVGPPPGNLPA